MAAAASKRAGAGGGPICDRLSALPDELLRHILSFLPAQQVVKTSVLSKRWMDLWRLVPAINLDLKYFYRLRSDHWRVMQHFANNFLMLHDTPCLDGFRLTACCHDHDSPHHLDTWIRRAIKGNPLVLEVHIHDCFCGNRSLYPLPQLRSSPTRRLKRLQLSRVTLDHSFVERLHSWWPQMECLDLSYCHIGFCRIASDILKKLAIVYCENPPADIFVIRAPALADLRLAICPLGPSYRNGISLYVGNSHVRASIILKSGEFSPRSEAMILGSLFSVTSLTMEKFQAMAILDKELYEQLPIFDNMRTLTLKSCRLNSSICDVHNFKALGRILQKFPNMEMLTLKYFHMVPIVELVEYPTLENLRTLILDTCYLCDNFELLHHYLRNSPNLEKLALQHCKVSDGSTAGEGKDKSKTTYSCNVAHLHCPKLRSTELIYYRRHNANIPALQRFLLGHLYTK